MSLFMWKIQATDIFASISICLEERVKFKRFLSNRWKGFKQTAGCTRAYEKIYQTKYKFGHNLR